VPQEVIPEQLQTVDLEDAPYRWNTPEDYVALELVNRTFRQYENGRRSHDQRWQVADRLYHGYVEKRYWEGTNRERANLAVPIVYDQVESAFPIITEALFEHYPTFFDVVPEPGTSPAEADQQRNLLAAFFEQPFDASGLNAIAEMSLAVKQQLQYGDGIVELAWDFGLKRPVIEWVDVRDIFLDPQIPGPVIDWSPAVIHRQKLSVERLRELRGVEGVNIPPDVILNHLAKRRTTTASEQTKMMAAAARKERLDLLELKPDPRHQEVDVLRYWADDRLIWVLGGVWVAVNQPNPYGFKPYCKAPLTVVTGRPYGMSLPDVLEGDQKYAQGIRNARLDNLNLSLMPPRKRVGGGITSPSKIAWRPGLIDEVSKADESDVYRVENVTADAYREEQIIHAGAAKRTGVSEMVQSGVPTPSNANRSATGVSAQQQNVSRRLKTAVKNFEDFLIVPLLYKMRRMMQQYAPEQLEAVAPTGESLSIHKATLDRPVKFVMQAASRMVARDRLGMFLPTISQLLFNDVVSKQAQMQGKTVDFGEFNRFFHDATGTSRIYNFFRDMTPEEQQKAAQPDPETMAQMQMQEQSNQTRLQMGQMKAQTDLMKILQEGAAMGEKSAVEVLKLLGGSSGANAGAEAGNSQSGNRPGVRGSSSGSNGRSKK
jgi:hypothetical protein